MNRRIQILSVLFLGIAPAALAQIKEEKLILDRKREPEVRKIEKKKTSVETIKNYPPQAKKTEDSLNLKYSITDVPAVSDFKTSTIQGEDISPKFNTEYQANYFRLGMGNYGKILADGNLSTMLESKMEVGADVHFLSTAGLKKEYDWSSKQNAANVGLYLNSYGDKGKFGIHADYGLDDYNYYGIYALKPAADTDLQQKISQFKLNGNYDFYANNYLDYVSLKSNFLSDHFDGKESSVKAKLALKKDIAELANHLQLSAEGDLQYKNVNTTFSLLNENAANHSILEFAPMVKLAKGESFIALGVNLNYVMSDVSTKNTAQKENSFSAIPQIQAQYAASDEFKFYAGLDGGTKLNSYADLLLLNPYLVSDQEIRPSDTKYHFYFGMKGDMDQSFKYDFSAGFSKIDNIMFFKANGLFDYQNTLNRSAYNYANTFSAAYDNGTVSEVKGSVQYFPLENLVLDAEVDFTQYKLNNYENILNRPLLTAGLGAKYSMLDKKLNLGAKAIFASDMTTNSYSISPDAANPSYFVTTENKNDRTKGYADLNLSAEYRIHKNFSIFALGNNLLNTKYETFKGYKVLGAQILGGVKISF